MKNISILTITLFLFTGCFKREGPNCHYDILIKNNSDKEIIATEFYYQSHIPSPFPNRLCKINTSYHFVKIKAKSSAEYSPLLPPRSCIEDYARRYEGLLLLSLIFIDSSTSTYSLDEYVLCSEFKQNVTILRYYSSIPLTTLQANNFTINYPEDSSIDTLTFD